MTQVYAPWSPEQVHSLNEYQASGVFHEFTGDNQNTLIATENGWVEVEGGPIYQTWAYDFMTAGCWKQSPIFQMYGKK